MQAVFPPLVAGFFVNWRNLLAWDRFSWHVNKFNSLSVSQRRVVQFINLLVWLSADLKNTLHQVILWLFFHNRRCKWNIKIASTHTLWLGNPNVRLTLMSACRKVAFLVVSNCFEWIRQNLIKPISPWRRQHINFQFFFILPSRTYLWVHLIAYINSILRNYIWKSARIRNHWIVLAFLLRNFNCLILSFLTV